MTPGRTISALPCRFDTTTEETTLETHPSAPERSTLDALRRRRAELRESMVALELALAGPAPRGQARWTERVHVALMELLSDLREHIDATEGRDGVYVDVLAGAPRLSGAVSRLTREHAQIRDLLEELLDRTIRPENVDVEEVRGLGTSLLGLLVRHRQRGSDLVYEAFDFDVGGEA
jgi:hypothetical protein